jgi:hypothetical protein
MAETIYYKIIGPDGTLEDFGFAEEGHEFVDVISSNKALGNTVEEITETEFALLERREMDFTSKVNYVMSNNPEDEFADPKKVKLTILIHALSSGHPDIKTLDDYYNWIQK